MEDAVDGARTPAGGICPALQAMNTTSSQHVFITVPFGAAAVLQADGS
jgi:hypothetical protein